MIEDLIRRIAETVPAVCGDNLTGLIIDSEHYFGTCAVESVEVEGGRDPLSIVTIHARVKESVASVQDISQALSGVLPQVVYNHFTASSVGWYKEATVLHFITVPVRGTYYVSGTVVATGLSYPRLLAAFEQEFSRIHGPVQSWRGRQ